MTQEQKKYAVIGAGAVLVVVLLFALCSGDDWEKKAREAHKAGYDSLPEDFEPVTDKDRSSREATVPRGPEPPALDAGPPAGSIASCPKGSKLVGEPPPEGSAQWCELDLRGYVHDKHGPFIRFHPNGKPAVTGIYDEGVKVGKWIEYHSDGRIKSEGFYERGLMSGRWVTYGADGRLQSEITYADGEMDGPYRTYYENGQVEEDGSYAKGARTGTWTRYGADGVKTSQGAVLSGMRHGEWSAWQRDPKTGGVYRWKSAGYDRDRLEGAETFYYANGQRKSSCEFHGGRRDGYCTTWDASGNVTDRRAYRNGKRVE